jgi:hypothetical protein
LLVLVVGCANVGCGEDAAEAIVADSDGIFLPVTPGGSIEIDDYDEEDEPITVISGGL